MLIIHQIPVLNLLITFTQIYLKSIGLKSNLPSMSFIDWRLWTEVYSWPQLEKAELKTLTSYKAERLKLVF